jgi:uncharacterized protein YxeA
MKNLRIAALALPLLFGCSVTFAAHHAPHHKSEMSFQQALDITEKAGYKNLHKIVLCHNHYKVEAYDANGKEVEFKIDAMTGAVSPATPAKHHKHHGKHHGKHHAKHVKHAKAAKAAKDDAKEDKAAN